MRTLNMQDFFKMDMLEYKQIENGDVLIKNEVSWLNCYMKV